MGGCLGVPSRPLSFCGVRQRTENCLQFRQVLLKTEQVFSSLSSGSREQPRMPERARRAGSQPCHDVPEEWVRNSKRHRAPARNTFYFRTVSKNKQDGKGKGTRNHMASVITAALQHIYVLMEKPHSIVVCSLPTHARL